MTQPIIPMDKKVEVNLSDLHMFYTALAAAHNYVDMEDMRDSLRVLDTVKRESPLAFQLKSAKDRASGIVSDSMRDDYLASDVNEEDIARLEDDGG